MSHNPASAPAQAPGPGEKAALGGGRGGCPCLWPHYCQGWGLLCLHLSSGKQENAKETLLLSQQAPWESLGAALDLLGKNTLVCPCR